MRYLLSIALISLAYCLSGQELNISINQIHEIKDLSVDNHIKCLAKDESGNLWVGADNGLYRYNGKDLNRIDIPFVKDMILTQAGNLLVVSDEGLYSIETSVFDWEVQLLLKSIAQESDTSLSFPKTIFQGLGGEVWIGENQSIVRYDNGNLKRFPISEQNVGNYLRHSFTFTEDGFGNLWVLAFSGILLRYDRMQEEFTEVELAVSLNEASEIASDGGEKIWIGTISGIFEINLLDKQEIGEVKKISDLGRIASMAIRDGNAMVASFDEGLFQFNTANYESQRLSSFEYLDILDIEHKGSQVWIAGSESIFVINSAPFYTFPQTLNQFVSTIQQAQDNTIIVNLGRQVFQARQSPKGMIFEPLFETGNQLWANDALRYREELWMATSQGIFRYALNTKRLNFIEGSGQNSWLNYISRSSEGNIWVSNQQDGPILKINSEGQVSYFPEWDKVRFVKESENKTLFGGEAGTFLIHTEAEGFQSISLDFAASKPDIFDLALSEDSIYLATSKGIYVAAKDQVEENEGIRVLPLVSDHVESIVRDKRGVIWFSHPRGLSKLENGVRLSFDRSQGLPSNYIIKRGLLVDHSNRLWVCTSKGLATLTPGALASFPTPQPTIVACNSNNQEIPVQGYDLGSFYYNSTIGLELLSLTYPSSSIQYQVRLLEEGQLLNQQITDGFLTLFGLQAGAYQLEIQAKQTGAEWSAPVQYVFSIRKKWYQTNWFRILLVLASIGLIYSLIFLYNRNLRQANEKLESLVSERTASLEAQKNELLQTQQQILAQQNELINKNEVLSETQKALNHSEIQFLELKRDQMRRELDLKTKQLTTHALSILQKNQYLLELSESLDELGKKKGDKEIASEVRKMSQHIRNSIKQDARWEDFRLYFEQVHDDFYAKLKISFPKLTNQDLKQCALVKLNLSLEDSATILGVSSESVRVSRYRIQKKMGMSSQAAFYEFLVKL